MLPNFLDVIKKNKHNKKSQNLELHVLSDVIFQPFNLSINYFLNNFNLFAKFKIGNYDQVFFEANQLKNEYKLVYIHTSVLKYITKISFSNTKNIDNKFKESLKFFEKNLTDLLISKNKITFIVNLFEYPPYRTLGTLSRKKGIINIIDKLNRKLIYLSQKNKNLLLNDLNYLSSQIGLENWFNYNFWAQYKQPFSEKAIVRLSASLSSIIASHFGQTKKVIITDLDNTLWGGIIGDDGIDNIQLGNSSPKGEIFSLVQASFLSHFTNGIILAVCSKNSKNNVIDIFSKETTTLKESNFSSLKINWKSKSENINEIANELNVGIDSILFVDDSKFEIDEVLNNHNKISVINHMDNPLRIANEIDFYGYFESQSTSIEDSNRNSYYSQNKKRNEALLQFTNYDNFLKSLKMESHLFINNSNDVMRLVALNNKTNQFNLTQYKITENIIKNYINDKNKIIISNDLKDKFGQNGIVSLLYGRILKQDFIIDNWVMSCRVFNRTLENQIFTYLINYLDKKGIKKIKIKFNKTEKNDYCDKFMKLLFGKSLNKNNEYQLDIHNYFLNEEKPHEESGNIRFYS